MKSLKFKNVSFSVYFLTEIAAKILLRAFYSALLQGYRAARYENYYFFS